MFKWLSVLDVGVSQLFIKSVILFIVLSYLCLENNAPVVSLIPLWSLLYDKQKVLLPTQFTIILKEASENSYRMLELQDF